MHPLIEAEGPYAHRADYYTPNGFCYYRGTERPELEVGTNIESQCGLLGTLQRLSTGQPTPITIQEPFEGRCNDIIDVPDVGGQLRSGETLPPARDLSADCGLLHRLSPALVSVEGDSAEVSVWRAWTLNV